MDAEKTGAEEVFPLADPGFVAVRLTVTGVYPDLGITGLYIQNIRSLERDLLVVGDKGNRGVSRVLPVEPINQHIVAVGQDGEDGGDKDRIAEHGWQRPFGTCSLPKSQLQQEGFRRYQLAGKFLLLAK